MFVYLNSLQKYPNRGSESIQAHCGLWFIFMNENVSKTTQSHFFSYITENSVHYWLIWVLWVHRVGAVCNVGFVHFNKLFVYHKPPPHVAHLRKCHGIRKIQHAFPATEGRETGAKGWWCGCVREKENVTSHKSKLYVDNLKKLNSNWNTEKWHIERAINVS